MSISVQVELPQCLSAALTVQFKTSTRKLVRHLQTKLQMQMRVLELAPHFELETLVRNSAAFTLVAQPVQRLR